MESGLDPEWVRVGSLAVLSESSECLESSWRDKQTRSRLSPGSLPRHSPDSSQSPIKIQLPRLFQSSPDSPIRFSPGSLHTLPRLSFSIQLNFARIWGESGENLERVWGESDCDLPSLSPYSSQTPLRVQPESIQHTFRIQL